MSGDELEAGVRKAIDWIRAMPRRELVVGRVRIREDVYRLVADSVARHLEERLELAERPTDPSMRTLDEERPVGLVGEWTGANGKGRKGDGDCG